MYYELNPEGYFISDIPQNEDPEVGLFPNWTRLPLPQPVSRPKFTGNRLYTGEWIGSWIDLGELPMTTEQQANMFKAAIQNHMDDAARAVGYDDIKTAVTYADEPSVPKFQNEGRAFRAWRSQCWAYGYQEMDKVLGGTRPMPTVEQIISELPTLVLP